MTSKLRTLDIAGTPVFIGNLALVELSEFLQVRYDKNCNFYILVDNNTREHCIPPLLKQIPFLSGAEIICIESGEQNKTIQTCELIWKELADKGANRNSVLLNLGGGVISDMGGFVASTFHRGMTYINIPTTLMAMIDASLGGKTGVDLYSLKNIIGLFANPAGVFVWPGFLKSLPHRFMLSGYAEMLKHAIIADYDFWKKLCKLPMALVNDWNDLIYHAAFIKCKIVNNDPLETGLRRLLNFGHTIGHSFETFSLRHDASPLSHGEAVAMGIICESYISYRLLDMPHSQRDEVIKNILLNFNHYNLQAENIPELVDITVYDKKNRNGKIILTLIKEIGRGVEGQECDAAIIRESLFRYTDFRRSLAAHA